MAMIRFRSKIIKVPKMAAGSKQFEDGELIIFEH